MTNIQTSYLIKSLLHRSLAEGVYRDIQTRKANYYYMMGKTIPWNVNDDPPYPINSLEYERITRSEAITYKAISASDVSFVVPRINWTANTTYDMYDDMYSGEVIGLEIESGGDGYTSLPTITVTGGGGSGASFGAIVDTGLGKIIGIQTFAKGSGYTSNPTVTVTGGGGANAILNPVVKIGTDGANTLEDAKFYVLTDEFNVYKCLDNNNNSQSTTKPSGTQTNPILTPDGYIWKYMYNIPIGLRNKFLTTEHMPVISALTNNFYSNGQLEAITINNRGSGYLSAYITVEGDGYRELDPIYIQNLTVTDGGSGYTGGSVVTISDPFADASAYVGGASVSLGQKIYNSTKDFYEVASPGILGSTEATHKNGLVLTDSYVGTLWTSGHSVVLGEQYYYGNNLYQVTQAGTTGGTPPSSTDTENAFSDGTAYLIYIKPTPKGTAVLKYLGTTAKATATLSGDTITGINFIGSLRDIEIINAGSGYTYAPQITLVGGGGSNATAYCKLNGTSVLYADVINQGDGYISAPTVKIGVEWTNGGTVHLNEQIYYGNHLYTVTAVSQQNAILGSVAPTHTSGTFVSGQATLTYAGTVATAVAILKYGSGYSKVPDISVSIGTGFDYVLYSAKSAAKLVPVIENGQISGITVVDGGVGYTNAVLTVNSTSGTGASLSANLSVGNIQSLQANNEILATAGAIDAINVVSCGYGYGSVNIIIQGDGQNCAAEAVIDPLHGSITKINILNRGSGYTYANVIINGNGYAANARAIIAPYGGHGKNSPEELFARTLMFYSNMSSELNQGMVVNNDYRQVGIVKNPSAYGTTNRYTSSLGSGCFIIQSNINTNLFAKDDLVFINRGQSWTPNTAVVEGNEYYYQENLYLVTQSGTTGNSGPSHTYGNQENGNTVLLYIGTPRRYYRIVSVTSTSCLLQSLENDIPTVADTILNNSNNSFKPIAVGNPTIDRYSGQLMYIDNKAGFTPSENETVSFRTVIKF